MTKITFNCDRCGNEVTGYYDEHFTAGYYNVSEGSPWHRFAKNGMENGICDHCMWSDPEYQTIYSGDGEMQQWMKENCGN